MTYPRATAIAVAKQLCDVLTPFTHRLGVAGSLRRGKQSVGDVEILFIPKTDTVPDGLFDKMVVSLADAALDSLFRQGIIAKRKNSLGSEVWGAKNKLAVHLATGIPVDLFVATESNWWNYLVCRTGGAQTNVRIASAAQHIGWKWNPYGVGFSRPSGLGEEIHAVQSEREVFEFVRIPYLEPSAR